MNLIEESSRNFSWNNCNLFKVLEKFQHYSNKKRIRGSFNYNKKNYFETVTEEEVRQGISHLYISDANQVGDIPIDKLKLTVDIHKVINLSLRNYFFPNHLKSAEVSHIFEKDDDLEREKESDRPASILSHVSKAFERIMYT